MYLTNIGNTYVWRTRGIPYISLATAFQIDTTSEPWKIQGDVASTFRAWRDRLVGDIPAGKSGDVLVECLSVLDPRAKNKQDDLVPLKFWGNLVAEYNNGKTQAGSEWDRKFVAALTDLACSDELASLRGTRVN